MKLPVLQNGIGRHGSPPLSVCRSHRQLDRVVAAERRVHTRRRSIVGLDKLPARLFGIRFGNVRLTLFIIAFHLWDLDRLIARQLS